MASKNKNKDKNKDDDDNVQLMQHILMAHLTLADRPIYRVNSSCDEQGTPPYISMKDVYAALKYPGNILIYKDEFGESPIKIHKSTTGDPDWIRFYPRQILYFRCPTQEGDPAPSSADASPTAQHRQDPSLPDFSSSASPTWSSRHASPSARSTRRSRRSFPLTQSPSLRSSARIRSARGGSSQAQPVRDGSPQAQSSRQGSPQAQSAHEISSQVHFHHQVLHQAQHACNGSQVQYPLDGSQSQFPFESSSQFQSPREGSPQTQFPRDGSSRASPPQSGPHGASPSRARAPCVSPIRSNAGGASPPRRRASTPYPRPTSTGRDSETGHTAGSSRQCQQPLQQSAQTQSTGDSSPPALANPEPATSGTGGDTGGGGGDENRSPYPSVPAQPRATLPDHNMLSELITDVGNLNDGTRLRLDRLRLRIDQMQQENWDLQQLNQDLQERNQILRQDIESFLQENERVKNDNVALERLNKERFEKGLAYRTETDGLRKTVQDLDDESKHYQRQLRDLQVWNEELCRREGTYDCSYCYQRRSSASGAAGSLSSSARTPVFPRPPLAPIFLYPSSPPLRQAPADPREGRPLPSSRSRLSQHQVQEPSTPYQRGLGGLHHQQLQGQHHQEQHHTHEQHHQGHHYYHEQRQEEQHREGPHYNGQRQHQEQRHHHEGPHCERQRHHQEQCHHSEGSHHEGQRHHQEQHHQGQNEHHQQRQSSKSTWDHWDTYGFDVVAFDNLPHDDHAWVMPERPDEQGGWITRTISMAARNRALESELPFLPRAPKGQYTTAKTVESYLKIHRRTAEAVKDVQIYTGGPDGAPSSSDISSTNADAGSSGRASYVDTPQLGGSPAYAILIEHDDNDATGAAAATIVRAHRSQSRVSHEIEVRAHRSQIHI